MESHRNAASDWDIRDFEDTLRHPVKHLTEQAKKATGWWWLYTLLGLVSIALGVTALASRIDGLATLVAVFAVSLMYIGVAEIAFATTTRTNRAVAIVAGVLSIVAGILALTVPNATLIVLTVLVGASLVGWGVYRIYLSFTDPLVKPRAVALVEGILLIALGVMALAWPHISVLVLAIIVGLFFLVFGICSFVGSLHLLDLHHALKKAEHAAGTTRKDEDDATTHPHHKGLHHGAV
ncbi:MAG TPA: HdeD family acid-resistance protein [Thermoleophilia bacterium]|nr:HdeD family acid-resistance protein [Thermoleophilia bacterium]